MAERHSPPPLLLCPTFGSALPIIGLHLRMGPFFLAPPGNLSPVCQFAYLLDRMSLCLLHSSHAFKCIADQKVKTYIEFVAGEAAPYPPPSDPLLATPDRNRILLPRRRSTGLAHILLPCAGPKLAIWLRPYHQAPTSVGASFFRVDGKAARSRHTNLHGSTSHCAFVLPPALLDIAPNGGVRGDTASSKVSGFAEGRTAPPIPSGGAIFVFRRSDYLRQAIPAQNAWIRFTASSSSALLAA